MASALRLLHVAPLPPPWTGIGVSVQHTLASAPLMAQANWVVNSSRVGGALSNGKPKGPTPERMLRHAHLAARVGRLVREHQIQVVHLHGSTHDLSVCGNWLSIAVARVGRAHTVWHLHEDLSAVAFPGRTPFTRGTFAALMATPDTVAVLTTRDRRLASGLVAEPRLAVVPPTCSPELLSLPIVRPHAPVHVLYVGWLAELKGIYDLLRIASVVCRTRQDITFDVLGTGRTPADTDAVRREIEHRGLTPSVLLHGVKTGRAKLAAFARANLLCTPTHWDAFPVTVLEAMSAGLPVVGTRVGGLPSMLKEEHGGVLTPVGDVETMADALLELAGTAQRREAMGAANRARFLERYHPDRVGQLMVDLDRRLVGEAS
ncbi:MAG TPA: glycosyltransferase [Chloroflexota bacterium]|nr:glycosyltransferase [Chloroflexota bacterium]